MTEEAYSTELQSLIDRAGSLTAEETETLGQLWEAGEDLVLPSPLLRTELFGQLDFPVVTNQELLAAWQHAARAAGRAATRDERHFKESESSKNGAEEAVRSAVLAVGVRDLISDADYQTLVSPWQQVLGAI
jgi:hypothetical protein